MSDEFDEPKNKRGGDAPQKIVIPTDSLVEPSILKDEEEEPSNSLEV